MSLATASTVQTNCGFAAVSTARITPHLPAAAALVTERVGSTIYAAVVAAAGDGYDAALRTAFTRAESLLCGAILLRAVLQQASDGGIVAAQFSPDGASSSLATARQREAAAAAFEAEACATLAPWEAKHQAALAAAGETTLPASVCRAGRLTLAAMGAGLQGADRA